MEKGNFLIICKKISDELFLNTTIALPMDISNMQQQ